MKKITAVLLTLILAFSLAQAAFASVDNGTLSISATDSSGAQVNVPKANAGERVTERPQEKRQNSTPLRHSDTVQKRAGIRPRRRDTHCVKQCRCRFEFVCKL